MENNKAELIITALQQRIAEMTANYELQIALLRAELTILTQQQEDKKIEVEKYEQELIDKLDL